MGLSPLTSVPAVHEVLSLCVAITCCCIAGGFAEYFNSIGMVASQCFGGSRPKCDNLRRIHEHPD